METTPVQTPLLLSPKGKSTPLVASLFLFTAISEVIMFLSKFHPSDHSDAASEERDALVRIKDSLRKAAVELPPGRQVFRRAREQRSRGRLRRATAAPHLARLSCELHCSPAF